MVEVAAALIRRDARFLICRRPFSKARGGLWEFVGGKLEKGETPEQALVRECFEELSVTVEPIRRFFDVEHVYPDITVHLTLIEARIVSDEITLNEHIGMEWITPEQIPQFDFCPADDTLLEKIKEVF